MNSSINRRSLGGAAAVLLAMAMLAMSGKAIADEAKPVPAPAPSDAAKSSPPDLNHYMRPAIPEDRMQTPLQRPGGVTTAPLPGARGDRQPTPRTDGATAAPPMPQPNGQSAPQPNR